MTSDDHRSFFRRAAFVAALLISAGAQAATPWETYVNDPTNDHARAVKAISYTKPPKPESVTQDLDVLHEKVQDGNKASIDLAFRLERIADGKTKQNLDVTLGDLIRPYPRMFLKKLNQYRRPTTPLDPIVNTLGSDYTGLPGAQRTERLERAKSLLRINDPDVRSLRDECITALRSR